MEDLGPIDAHAHLDRYHAELDSVLDEIARHRILTVSASMDPASYARNREIGRRCELVLPTFGIHPWNSPEYADHIEEFDHFVTESPMLGEVGLDFHFVSDKSTYPAQRRVFDYFLRAARDQDKVVTLHTKGAEEEVRDSLEQRSVGRAVIHWYSGPMGVFHTLVDRGYYFTIGVEVLRSVPIQAMASEIPDRLLLTETDNPGGMKWLTGHRGRPALVFDVIDALARLRGCERDHLIRQTQENFRRLMGQEPDRPEIRR